MRRYLSIKNRNCIKHALYVTKGNINYHLVCRLSIKVGKVPSVEYRFIEFFVFDCDSLP